jgi:hypothetical protein
MFTSYYAPLKSASGTFVGVVAVQFEQQETYLNVIP